MISGKVISLSLSLIMELKNPSAYLPQLFTRWRNLMLINRGIASARKYCGRWVFISSFRLYLHWVWAAYTTFHTLCYRKRYLLSARRESMNSKHSAADSKRWRSWSSAMLSLADWIEWGLTLLTCAWTWYQFECGISNVGHCFSIALSRSPLFVPQVLWTKCCFAA